MTDSKMPEPVAWRWKPKGDPQASWDIVRCAKFPIRGRLRDEYDAQPLYAHPATDTSAQGAVTVKPLACDEGHICPNGPHGVCCGSPALTTAQKEGGV